MTSNIRINENNLHNGIRYTSKDTNVMISNLIESECIREGYYKLKNGYRSKYYFDMKNLISVPEHLKMMSDKLYHMLGDFDIVCAIPYGGMPIASYISLKYNKPLIYLRDKAKNYGNENLIEGKYNANSKCVIIDDVFTSGNSLHNAIKILKDKVQIVDIGVLMNCQESFSDVIDDWRVKSLLYKNDYIKYRLKTISDSKNSRLCFAADIEDPVKLLDIVGKVGPFISVCKIHYDIINVKSYEDTSTAAKKDFVEDFIKLSIRHNFLIMEDRKFMDVSHIVAKQYAQFSSWVDLVTVHSIVANDTIAGLSGALVIANMSKDNYGYYEKAAELTRHNKNNVVGYVSHDFIEADGLICMMEETDSARVVGAAINHNENVRIDNNNQNQSKYIIVGKQIYEADNVVTAVQKYLNHSM